jgi:hypothetical protein
MRNRNLIHLNKIEDFKAWLQSKGWTLEPTKDCFEVIRARKDGELVIFYQRGGPKPMRQTEHLTAWGTGYQLSVQYIREKRKEKEDKLTCTNKKS